MSGGGEGQGMVLLGTLSNEFAWPFRQVSDLEVGCVALAKP